MSIRETTKRRAGKRRVAHSPRVLLMAGNPSDNLACTTLLESSGFSIQSCSSYIELLLYLEHEPFQLVVIFERARSQMQWHRLLKRVAEIDHGTPVILLKRSRDTVRLARNLQGSRFVTDLAA